MPHLDPTRRRVLASATASLVGLAVGCTTDPGFKPSDETGPDTGGPDTGGPGDSGLDTAEPTEDLWAEIPETCPDLSQDRGRGPFYLEGAPEQPQMNIYGREGTTIRMYVRVVDADCVPVAGAVVEVWHCGPDEVYVMDDEAMPFRATLTTDEEGRAWFETLEPPPYLDENGLMRPHIHYLITATGFVQKETQTKFAHDTELDEPVESPVVVSFEADEDGVLVGSHLFVIEREEA